MFSLGKGTWGLGNGERVYSYSYVIPDSLRFPQSFELAPHTSRTTQIRFELPAGHYQFFAGYGGGVHESKLTSATLFRLSFGEFFSWNCNWERRTVGETSRLHSLSRNMANRRRKLVLTPDFNSY